MAGLILAFLLLVAGGSPPSSGICTWTADDQPLDARITEQVKEADLIFEGVVLKIHDYPSVEARRLAKPDSSPVRFSFGERQYAFFSIANSWKGPYKRDLVVSTLRSESMCGYPFEEGEHYLVYAFIGEWGPTTNICTRTRPVSKAAEDRKKLEELFAAVHRGFEADSGIILRTARRVAETQGYSPRAYATDLLYRVDETPFVLWLRQKGERTAARLECRSAHPPGQIRSKAEAFLEEVDKRVESEQR